MGTAYLVADVLGLVALDEGGRVVHRRFFEWPSEALAERLILLERFEPIREILEFINELSEKGFTTVVVEDAELARNIVSRLGTDRVEVRAEVPSKGGTQYRLNFWDRYLSEALGLDQKSYYERLFEVSDLITRKKLRKAAEKRDLFIAQAISTLDDVDKILNLMASRIREWYGLHFPELEELVGDHREYVRLVYMLGHRSNFTVEAVSQALGWPEDRALKVARAAEKSVGADMAEWDLDQIKSYAKVFLDMLDYRSRLAEYIDEAMKEVAPNVRELVGPLLGARLVKLAGGLMKLAMLPASTIQVLGAEKALFRALRTGGKPPKHGIIFQFPEIFRAPRWQRGKIARALAAKLAIAAKADAFTGNFIAPRLKEELMKRIQEVKTLYAKPPPKQPPAQPQRRPERPARSPRPPRSGGRPERREKR